MQNTWGADSQKMNRKNFLKFGCLTAVAALTEIPGNARAQEGLAEGDAFSVFPSQPQTVVSYSRCEPLHCDMVEFDTSGCFVPWVEGNYRTGCFVAPVPCIVEFHANILFGSPPNGAEQAVWFMKNVLPTVIGEIGGEHGGDDVPVCQPANVAYNVSTRLTRMLKLAAGDRVWCVPGINTGAALTGAKNSGQLIVNYFQGKVIKVL